jgi:RNA polymerase sigma factor (sigma-70 family)
LRSGSFFAFWGFCHAAVALRFRDLLHHKISKNGGQKMSYHNDPYRVDYLKIYPCLKERPDVLEVLKKSDRKMKYMEVDLKSEQRRKNAENGAESYVPSKEDSLERLVYSAKCQFADDAEGVEDAVIKKDDLCRLRAALDQLSEEERALIHALFFDECSERELEEMMGIHRMTIHNRKIRILQKLKKMLR